MEQIRRLIEGIDWHKVIHIALSNPGLSLEEVGQRTFIHNDVLRYVDQYLADPSLTDEQVALLVRTTPEYVRYARDRFGIRNSGPVIVFNPTWEEGVTTFGVNPVEHADQDEAMASGSDPERSPTR